MVPQNNVNCSTGNDMQNIQSTLTSLPLVKKFEMKMQILTQYPSTINRLFESFRQFTNQTSNLKKLKINRKRFDEWTNKQGLTSLDFNLFKNQYRKINSDPGLHCLASKGLIRSKGVIDMWNVIRPRIPDLDSIESGLFITGILNIVKNEKNPSKRKPNTLKKSNQSLYSFKGTFASFINKELLDILNISLNAFNKFNECIRNDEKYELILEDRQDCYGLSIIEMIFFTFYVFVCMKKKIIPYKIDNITPACLRNYIKDRTKTIGLEDYNDWVTALKVDYGINFAPKWSSFRFDYKQFIIYPSLREYLGIISKGKWDYVRYWERIDQKMNYDKKNPSTIFDEEYFERTLKLVKSPVRIDQGVQTLPQLKEGSTNFDSKNLYPDL
jgi:hypothetical protein